MILVVSDNLLAAFPLNAENDNNVSSLFSFNNCSPPNSPAKLQGKLLLPDPASFEMILDRTGDFLMAHHPIHSLLSPPDTAVSLDPSPSSLPKYNQVDKTNPLPRRDNLPLKSASAFNYVMDAAALFKVANASPPRGSPLCKSYHSPLSALNNAKSVERHNPKSPLRNLQSRSLLID